MGSKGIRPRDGRQHHSRHGLVLAIVALVAASGGVLPMEVQAADNPVEAFYRGKTVTVVVGYGAGGGYDLYARTLARHLGRHIPGNPVVVVVNMPGAGSLVAVNHLYNVAPRDGTTLGMVSANVLLAQLIGRPEARFDATRFNWVGSMNAETYICIARSDAPVQTFADLFTIPVRFGGSGAGSESGLHPPFLNGVLGTKIELVSGYPGSNEIDLAIERGEVYGRCGHTWSSLKARRAGWVTGDKPFVRILVQMPRKHPELSHVPAVGEYARDQRVRELVETFFGPAQMGRPFALPPAVPSERVAALREAFVRTLRDPAFLKEADQVNLDLNGAMGGADVQALVTRCVKAPREISETIARYMP